MKQRSKNVGDPKKAWTPERAKRRQEQHAEKGRLGESMVKRVVNKVYKDIFIYPPRGESQDVS